MERGQELRTWFHSRLPDGRPATELEVTLADRELNFLVPADQLPSDLVAQLVHIAAESAERTDSGTQVRTAGVVTSDGIAAGRSSGSKEKSPVLAGKRLLVALVGIAVVVAVVLGVTLGSGASPKAAGTSTTTTRVTSGKTTPPTASPVPTHELTGPPDSIDPQAALVEVMIHSADLKSWKVAYGDVQDYPGQPQADADSNYDPFVPSASSVLEPSFGILQQCSALPLTHIQLLTGNYYAGGPPTWSSATFYPSNENLTQQSVTPQLYSIASLVSTVEDQKSDFAAMASPGFASCLSSYFSANLRATFSQQGDSVDDLSVKRGARHDRRRRGDVGVCSERPAHRSRRCLRVPQHHGLPGSRQARADGLGIRLDRPANTVWDVANPVDPLADPDESDRQQALSSSPGAHGSGV